MLDAAALEAALALIDAWRPPRFLLAGRDVMALGVPAGPRVGGILRQAEEAFIENGFAPAERAGQLALLRTIVEQT